MYIANDQLNESITIYQGEHRQGDEEAFYGNAHNICGNDSTEYDKYINEQIKREKQCHDILK